jgi:hypothetical protein
MPHESNTILNTFLQGKYVILSCYNKRMRIPVNFDPRIYQREALAALDRGVKLAIWCWARRGGKDFTAFGYAVKKMVEKPMNVVLVFPTKEQGKNSFWENVENDGFRTIEHIPKSLIARMDNNNMRLTLKNGSTFQIMGATDPDALRGANAKLYIFSEFVDIDSAAYDVIVPVVEANGGQVIIQSTPKIDGISGGTFKMMYDDAIKEMELALKEGREPLEYASMITAHEYLTPEALERLRQKAIRKYGNDFFFRQEFLCDWGQASSTSYYGAALQQNERKQLLGYFPWDRAHHVYTAWDLGTSDSTAITFFQYINKKIRIIDYFETHDIGYAPIVEFLKTKPYIYGHHFIPHDGSVREASDATQRIDKLYDLGLINASLLTRENREDGIRMAVEGMMEAEINESTTDMLLRKLRLYKRKFNGLTGDYEGPEHKTESHAADTIRYLFTAVRQFFDEKTGAFLMAPGAVSATYESVSISTPPLYRG